MKLLVPFAVVTASLAAVLYLDDTPPRAELVFVNSGAHSSAVVMPDGSVIAGGDPPQAGSIAPTPHERYYPDYFTAPRPSIANAPNVANYGTTITIDTPQASLIGEVVVMRPPAMTHGWNMSQRRVELEITSVAANSIDVAIPANANVIPPGWHLLHVVDGNRVPSEGRWIRITS